MDDNDLLPEKKESSMKIIDVWNVMDVIDEDPEKQEIS
jgi:hypothetical protein